MSAYFINHRSELHQTLVEKMGIQYTVYRSAVLCFKKAFDVIMREVLCDRLIDFDIYMKLIGLGHVMGGACGTCRREEKSLQGFNGGIRRKQTAWKS
jgi:hypothetical protein